MSREKKDFFFEDGEGDPDFGLVGLLMGLIGYVVLWVVERIRRVARRGSGRRDRCKSGGRRRSKG